jgi:hypothetical protein
MNSKFNFRNLVILGIVAILTLSLVLVASPASASEGNGDFKVQVKHRINGTRLGLDKELPVNVNIYKDGAMLATIEDFRFMETVNATLPAGNYFIQVTLPDGTPVPGLELGPVEIPAGANLTIIAKLDSDGMPTLEVRARRSK